MWEALMILRLMASIAPTFPIGEARAVNPIALPVETLKGAILLSLAVYRLSLPLPDSRNEQKS